MGEAVVDYWNFFAEDARRRDAHLYVRFAEGVGQDTALREFASNTRPGQPAPLILFAAVHYLLLRGARHKLRRFYPNLNGGTATVGEDPFPAFRDFVEEHRDELATLIATRVTNTNEVGRSGLLHAGFRAAAAEAGEPLHLIEIGPSAGLNLIWDRYGVRYSRGAEVCAIEPQNPALVIDVALRGETIPPLGRTPTVASRVGLELNPVDLGDMTQRDWLRALVWPDHVARFRRLEAALEAYAHVKPEIRAGDALALLPDALHAIPEDQPVCIYHTLVIYQFSASMREALENILTVAGLRRPVWRLGLEGLLNGEAPLLLSRYHDGTRDMRTLALCDPHGAWIDW